LWARAASEAAWQGEFSTPNIAAGALVSPKAICYMPLAGSDRFLS
jgi:hypothetical protein